MVSTDINVEAVMSSRLKDEILVHNFTNYKSAKCYHSHS